MHQNSQDFYSIVLDICLALTTVQTKSCRCSGHNLGKDKMRANPILICDVICRSLLYDCGM